jgi:hypothetical protein
MGCRRQCPSRHVRAAFDHGHRGQPLQCVRDAGRLTTAADDRCPVEDRPMCAGHVPTGQQDQPLQDAGLGDEGLVTQSAGPRPSNAVVSLGALEVAAEQRDVRLRDRRSGQFPLHAQRVEPGGLLVAC